MFTAAKSCFQCKFQHHVHSPSGKVNDKLMNIVKHLLAYESDIALGNWLIKTEKMKKTSVNNSLYLLGGQKHNLNE